MNAKKPFDTIPTELQSKPILFVGRIREINKELRELGLPIQIKMEITEHRKSDWNKEENIYWEQSVDAYNYLSLVDTPLGSFI